MKQGFKNAERARYCENYELVFSKNTSLPVKRLTFKIFRLYK